MNIQQLQRRQEVIFLYISLLSGVSHIRDAALENEKVQQMRRNAVWTDPYSDEPACVH